jgi:hypothetical protein
MIKEHHYQRKISSTPASTRWESILHAGSGRGIGSVRLSVASGTADISCLRIERTISISVHPAGSISTPSGRHVRKQGREQVELEVLASVMCQSPFLTCADLVVKIEKSDIQTTLRDPSPIRADGRSLLDYRSIAFETDVASLANGSTRLSVGRTASEESSSGTEVVAAVKWEDRVYCPLVRLRFCLFFCFLSITKPTHQQHVLATLPSHWIYLTTRRSSPNQYFSHPSLHPKDLGIILDGSLDYST